MAKLFNFFQREPIILTGQTTEEWVKMCKKKEFNINDYKGKYVMHCKTKEEAKSFCHLLHCLGRTWCIGSRYLSYTYWERYGKDTCYNFNEDCYGDIEWYQTRNFTILEWEDFMSKKEIEYTAFGNYQKFTKCDLKSGDILTFRNGDKGVVFLEQNIVIFKEFTQYIALRDYDVDLHEKFTKDWDIIKVQRPNDGNGLIYKYWHEAPVIWEREETVEMTLAEVCKALSKNVKIVKE